MRRKSKRATGSRKGRAGATFNSMEQVFSYFFPASTGRKTMDDGERAGAEAAEQKFTKIAESLQTLKA